MMYRNSVSSSKTANCQDLEDTNNHSLRYLQENVENDSAVSFKKFSIYPMKEQIHTVVSSFSELKDHQFSHYEKNILYYIASNAGKKFLQKFPCHFCEGIILNKDVLCEKN